MPLTRTELLQKAFPELPSPLLSDLAQKARLRTYPMGTVLCKEGQAEDIFYIICAGRVAVSKLLDGETSRILSYQGPGEFFGELALVHDNQRVATVVTIEETTVFELGKADFMSFLENSPSMVVTIMRAVAWRLRDADQKSITELRRKNAELNRAYHTLEAETKLRSGFLSTVAHELRTPLTTVKNQLNWLDSDQITDTQVENTVGAVSDNIDAVVQLVNNILFLQELELIEPQFRPVAVDEIVCQTVTEIAPSAKRLGVSLHLNIASQLPPVMGDAGSLKQAITALLTSVIRFSAQGGNILIDVLHYNQSFEIAIHSPNTGTLQLDIEHIFDRAYLREKAETYLSGGFGLELPIAKAVVEQHHGQLYIESQAEQGSTFTIHLPITNK